MVSSKNVKGSQKRCLGTSIESFTGSSPIRQIIVAGRSIKVCQKHLQTIHLNTNRCFFQDPYCQEREKNESFAQGLCEAQNFKSETSPGL